MSTGNTSPPHASPRAVFERQFEHEVLLSERLRVTIGGIFAATVSVVFTVALFIPPVVEVINRLFGSQLEWYYPFLLVGPMALFELAAWIGITRALRSGGHISPFLRYFNAFVETSLPTVLILFAGRFFGLIYAINTPPLLLYFLFIAISALRLDFWLCVFTGAVAAAEYAVLAYVALSQVGPNSELGPVLIEPLAHIGKSFIFLLTGVIVGVVTGQIRGRITASLRTIEERNRIIGLFGQHVSPEVVERLLTQDTQLASETRDVTVMFLDIRNFTRFAENKQPHDVVAYLNALFEFMVDSVNRHQGIINKFLGDGFMAVFGAPLSSGKDTRNAVDCAMEIIQRVEDAGRDGRIPPTRVGIGIHSGHAVTGNVGASERQEYTIIGDVVNLASRIEALNKQFESRLLVSQSVWEHIEPETVTALSLGAVEVRGHKVPIEVYKLA